VGGGPRQYRRAEVDAAIEVEGMPEPGLGPRQWRRADVVAAIEVEGRPEGGGPRQYRRAEVEVCSRGIQQRGLTQGRGTEEGRSEVSRRIITLARCSGIM
jgi:hypothetical protein